MPQPRSIQRAQLGCLAYILLLGIGCASREATVSRLAAPASGAPPAGASPGVSAGSSPGSPPGSPPGSSRALPPPGLRLPDYARPLRYALDLTLIPGQERYSGTVQIQLQLDRGTDRLWLHAQDLTILQATIHPGAQARPASPAADVVNVRPAPSAPSGPAIAATAQSAGDFLLIQPAAPVGPGAVTLTLRFQGLLDRTRSRGLYQVEEPPPPGTAAPPEPYIYTFFEPVDARRAFPCFDEPIYKVPWRLTLHVRRGDVALANAPVQAEADEPGGLKVVRFAETPPLPSYLVALIVGPFDLIEGAPAGRLRTPFRIAVPRGRGGETAYALRVTPRIVSLLEDYFDIPYPYTKLDVAVVPRFWGTMEHPGLVALGQPLLLIRPAEESLQRQQLYANVAAHELGHYWQGDLVTAAFWDDIWLNEAMTEWLDKKITAALAPEWRYELRQLDETHEAMSEDEHEQAKRVRQPVLTRDDITNAFDGAITYAKGAAVLRMFESWLGPDQFRAGVRRYLKRHAHKNATTADFLDSVLLGADAALRPALEGFFDRPGVPEVSVALRCGGAGGSAQLHLRQRRFVPAGSKLNPADAGWRIPVCVRYGGAQGGGAGAGRACLLLTEAEGDLALPVCPAWVMANADGVGYYRVSYTPALRARLLSVLPGSQLSVAERASVLSDTQALAARGDVPLGDEVRGVLPLLRDPDPRLVRDTLGVVQLMGGALVPDELMPRYRAFLRRTYGARARALGLRERPGEDSETRRLRPVLLYVVGLVGEDGPLVQEARGLARRYVADRDGRGAAVAPDLVPVVLRIAARHGDRAWFQRVVAAARGARDRRERQQLLGSLGAVRAPELVREALSLSLGEEFDLRDTFGILSGLLDERETREAAYGYVKAHLDELLLRMRDDEALELFDVPAAFCDEAHRADAAAFFGERARRQDGAPRQLANALEDVVLCMDRKRRQQPSVVAFLRGLGG